MKVEISYDDKNRKTKEVYKGDVTVIYPSECQISHISLISDGSTHIFMAHPCTANVTKQSDYPQKMLWLKPAYRGF